MISQLFVTPRSGELPVKLPEGPDSVILISDELKIGVEEIRGLKNQINIKPVKSVKTVVILQAEKLTTEAQNALLKTLEEPPENTQIILVAANANLLLPTILSRCQIINLPRPATRTSQAKLPDNLAAGFAWAKKFTSRQVALAEIDQLIISYHQTMDAKILRKLLKAKKYLAANTNIRLTLENLFLD